MFPSRHHNWCSFCRSATFLISRVAKGRKNVSQTSALRRKSSDCQNWTSTFEFPRMPVVSLGSSASSPTPPPPLGRWSLGPLGSAAQIPPHCLGPGRAGSAWEEGPAGGNCHLCKGKDGLRPGDSGKKAHSGGADWISA